MSIFLYMIHVIHEWNICFCTFIFFPNASHVIEMFNRDLGQWTSRCCHLCHQCTKCIIMWSVCYLCNEWRLVMFPVYTVWFNSWQLICFHVHFHCHCCVLTRPQDRHCWRLWRYWNVDSSKWHLEISIYDALPVIHNHFTYLWIFKHWQINGFKWCHYIAVKKDAMASKITSHTIRYWTVYSGADQGTQQSSASLAFVWGIHRWPVNSPHKWPVTRKIFPFDDVITVLDISDNYGCKTSKKNANTILLKHTYFFIMLCFLSHSN